MMISTIIYIAWGFASGWLLVNYLTLKRENATINREIKRISQELEKDLKRAREILYTHSQRENNNTKEELSINTKTVYRKTSKPRVKTKTEVV